MMRRDGAAQAPLAILGGTFDPVHLGHLRLAEEASVALGLPQITWVPAGRPPHRDTPRVSSAHRLAMAELAIAGNPRFLLDRAEALSETPSYSVVTLERLRQAYGAERPIVMLLGADAFAGIRSWHRHDDLFRLAHIAVATRPGHALDALRLGDEISARLRHDPGALHAAPAGAIVPFEITALDISATAIRAMLAKGGSCRYLLPDPVLDYIGRHRLYQDGT